MLLRRRTICEKKKMTNKVKKCIFLYIIRLGHVLLCPLLNNPNDTRNIVYLWFENPSPILHIVLLF